MFIDWKTIPLRRQYSFTLLYRVKEIPIKVPTAFLAEIKNTDLKIYMEMQGTHNSQNNLEKQEQS